MSTKNNRLGGKYTGHTTVTPVTGEIVDAIYDCNEIKRIQIGWIDSGLRPAGGIKRVKIIDKKNVLLLSIRGGRTMQEVIIYTKNIQDAKLFIARKSRDIGFRISFKSHT